MAVGVGDIHNNRLAYLYTLPALIVMGMVVIYPFFYNIVLSFSNMNLIHFKNWRITGISNYTGVFKESTFWYFLVKTVLWTAVNVVFHVTIGIFLALILNKDIKGKSFFRTLLILPWAVPQYITALTWRGMFDTEYGAVSLTLVKLFGIQIPWLTTEWGAFAACIITKDIDGASWWHKLKNITIPLIKPVMIPAITLGIIWTFNNFNIVWLVSNGGEPADKTHILVSWIYKSGFRYFRMAYAAAFSMIIFSILLIFSWNFIKRTKAVEAVY